MKDRDKIKDKIKALLSKTIDNGATKEEMESALKKANELMLQFFISEHEITDDEIIEKCILKEVLLTKSAYDLSLFYADLSVLFDCEYFYNSRRIAFFGHEQDVELCGYFYNVISKTCLKEKDKYIKTENYKYLKRYHHGRTLASSFIKGFLVEVILKMKAMYDERKSNIPEQYGLMVIEKDKKVKKEFAKLDLNLNILKHKGINAQTEAFNNGLEAGKQLDLIQGINSCKQSNRYAIGN